VTGQLSRPSTLNRYTYATGDPVTGIDPDGHSVPNPNDSGCGSAPTTLSRVLKWRSPNMVGCDVEWAQVYLALDLGTGWDGVDGVYGYGTFMTVELFQLGHGLSSVDGEVGPKTWAALRAGSAESGGDVQGADGGSSAGPTSSGEASRPSSGHISEAGAGFIAKNEGGRSKDGKYYPYNDAKHNKGYCTIGIGHKLSSHACSSADFSKYSQGMTRDQAVALFQKDAPIYEKQPRSLVKVPLNQGEFDALVDFSFNAGQFSLGGSTLLKDINKRRWGQIRGDFGMWDKGRDCKTCPKKVIPGLVNRRKYESDLFLLGKYR